MWLDGPSRHERFTTPGYDGTMKYAARLVVSTTHGGRREKNGVVERERGRLRTWGGGLDGASRECKLWADRRRDGFGGKKEHRGSYKQGYRVTVVGGNAWVVANGYMVSVEARPWLPALVGDGGVKVRRKRPPPYGVAQG